MTSHRSSPRPHLPHLAWLVSALVLLSLLGWSGVPATSAPSAPALTLYSPAPGALHLTWPAVTPAPPAYHVRYAPADTPTLIEQATSPTPSLTLYELEPGVVYTVQVRAGTGPWSVPVLQRIDDYRADPETVGTIGVGAEETGYIESAGDTDWFFVDLAAGEGYPIAVTGAPAPSLAVYEATGAVVQQGLAWHHASALTFTPATAGLYHVAVGGPAAEPGHYTLTVDEPPSAGPRRTRTLAGATPTATPAPQRATAAPAKPTGLSATASHDQVVLAWDDPNDASITGYVILRRVRENDTGGKFSVLVADTGSAATTYTDATVSANTTYTYRIKAINAYGVSKRSRWFHIDIPAAPEPEGQAAEPPTKPTGLSATATHNTVVLTWDDPDDDSITGYVILRRVRVNDTGGEFSVLVADTGAAATTYTDATVKANTTYTYRIKATNEHGVSERSRWSHIDTPAAPEAVEGDDQDGEDDDGAPGGPGKRANVSEPDGGDLPTDDTTTGEVDVGGSVTGNIGSGTDGDWFKVVLEAGTRYQIDLEGADTSRGTLPDPRMSLYYSNAVVGPLSNDEGVGKNARRIYTPDAAGDYYVRAQNVNGSDTGTYTLSMIVLGANGVSEADTDFPATTATTGRVDVGASVTGNLSSSDNDGFLVDLEAGQRYRFDLEGAPTGRGTLPDPSLVLYDGDEGYIAEDDDGGEGLNSRLTFKSPATDTYLLTVEDASSDSGTYTLSVRALGALPVAVPEGGLGPRDVPGAVRDVEVSYRSSIGQIVWWDAPDETQTGAQWITEFHIYGSVSGGCDGYLLDEYVVDHLGFTTPPTDSNGNPTGFKYFKQVDVGPVRFGVAAVNALGEGPCAEGPDDPPDPISYDEAACKLNPGDIWCGVITVGNIMHEGSTIAHGFLDGPVGGELVDNTGDRELFTGLKVYTVKGIYVGSVGALDGNLFVSLDEDLSDDESAALALHIDVDGTTLQLDIVTNGVTTSSDTWPFSETDTFSSIKGQYAWTGENLDWSAATTVTVRLRGTDDS